MKSTIQRDNVCDAKNKSVEGVIKVLSAAFSLAGRDL